jgi:hypothetical protein
MASPMGRAQAGRIMPGCGIRRPPDCYACHLTLHHVPDDGKDSFTLVASPDRTRQIR